MSATSRPEPPVSSSPSDGTHQEGGSSARSPRPAPAILFALAMLCCTALAALLYGTERTSIVQALSDPQSVDRLIILRARLPRILLAACAGSGLSVVGAVLQVLLRNALAEPYLLGVSGGAAVGATLAILAGVTMVTWGGAILVPISAFVGGLCTTALVYGMARATRRMSGTDILLSGIILNAMASALVTFAKSFGSAARTQELINWLMGFVSVPSLTSLATVSTYVAIGVGLLWASAGRLNLLVLGEEPAAHLGVDVPKTLRRVFLLCSLITGSIVSVTGLIGFVGLIVPHAARRLVGPDLRLLLPVCVIAGATTLIASDLVARVAFVWLGSEPPVGAVTALIGGPLSLVLLARGRQNTG